MRVVNALLVSLAVIGLPALAQSSEDINTFTKNASTQGEAVIADSPAGPLGLRFSGGLIIDSEIVDGQFDQSDLDRASPYLGIGVVQSLGNIDLSADLGWIERESSIDSLDGPTIRSEAEPVLNVQFRLRF